MANKYKYGWDAINKKKVYMGKYSEATPRGQGYFGRDDAGNKRYKEGGSTPDKREFIGSGMEEYTFSDELHGTRTIVAESYPEALRIAESFGYTKDDYKKRKSKAKR